jgi:hypothetical protein
MLIYRGGLKVGKGTYWNPSDGHRVDIGSEGILPGDNRIAYLKVPPGGILLIAPLMGLLYVVFLPFFGIGSVVMMWLLPILGMALGIALIGIKACNGMLALVGKNASFGWSPSTAYLSGKKKKVKKETKETKQ